MDKVASVFGAATDEALTTNTTRDTRFYSPLKYNNPELNKPELNAWNSITGVSLHLTPPPLFSQTGVMKTKLNILVHIFYTARITTTKHYGSPLPLCPSSLPFSPVKFSLVTMHLLANILMQQRRVFVLRL